MHSGVKYLGFIHIAHHAAGTSSGRTDSSLRLGLILNGITIQALYTVSMLLGAGSVLQGV